MRVLTRASEVPPLTIRAVRAGAAVLAAALAVAGCGSAPIEPAGALAASVPSACPGWLGAQQRGEGRLYRVDPAASQVRIHVFRGGRLAKVGHNHVLGVERLGGHVFVPTDGIAGAGLDLAFRIDDVAIDKPEWRTPLGPEFASTPSASDIAGTRANMLKAIEAERFPVITMRSASVGGAFPMLAVKLAIQWHGQTKELDVPVRVGRPRADSPLRAQAALVLRQSDFGITPFAVLGGLLAIQDELTVDVDVSALAASACE